MSRLFNPPIPDEVAQCTAIVSQHNVAALCRIEMQDLGINQAVFNHNLRPLLQKDSFPQPLMDIVMTLFSIRDHTTACKWHADTHAKVDREGRSTYKPTLRNYFLPCGFSLDGIGPFLANNAIDTSTLANIFQPLCYADSDNNAESHWAAVCIDVENKKLYLLYPLDLCSVDNREHYRFVLLGQLIMFASKLVVNFKSSIMLLV